MQGRANANLAVGYGFTGILVAFLARHNPLAIIPVAILLGGIGASGGLLQRRLGLPDASVLVLQGMIFVLVLASETLYGRFQSSADAKAGLSHGGRRRHRAVERSARRARRRHPRQHAVPVRQPRRMHHRAQRPHQSRPRRHAGDGRDVRLRHVLSHRLALARRARGGLRRRAAGRAARRRLRAAARQRHRGRHRADAVRHRPRVLSRQAADRAERAAPAVDRLRRLERHPAGARGAAGQRAVPDRRRARAVAGAGRCAPRAGA